MGSVGFALAQNARYQQQLQQQQLRSQRRRDSMLPQPQPQALQPQPPATQPVQLQQQPLQQSAPRSGQPYEVLLPFCVSFGLQQTIAGGGGWGGWGEGIGAGWLLITRVLQVPIGCSAQLPSGQERVPVIRMHDSHMR